MITTDGYVELPVRTTRSSYNAYNRFKVVLYVSVCTEEAVVEPAHFASRYVSSRMKQSIAERPEKLCAQQNISLKASYLCTCLLFVHLRSSLNKAAREARHVGSHGVTMVAELFIW
jgi:hypothetical protein